MDCVNTRALLTPLPIFKNQIDPQENMSRKRERPGGINPDPEGPRLLSSGQVKSSAGAAQGLLDLLRGL